MSLSKGKVVRSGVLKKLKTNRRKFFVLRDETPETLARLEYYDSEKKYRNDVPPKRSIALKTCFNINKRHDIKNKHVIALYTKLDCFCIVFEKEEELQEWLKDMLVLQHGEEIPQGQPIKPKFEYVWQVFLCERGLGAGNSGIYRLCLSDKTLTLIKRDDPECFIEIDLVTVRSCGVLKSYFYLEIGRSSVMGAGELWTEAPDYLIAYNIQNTVQHRFKACHSLASGAMTVMNDRVNDLSPAQRNRSSSATESSKTKENNNNNNTKKQSSVKFFQGGIWPKHLGGNKSTSTSTAAATATSATSGATMTASTSTHTAAAESRSTSTIMENSLPSCQHCSASVCTLMKRPAQCSKTFRDRCGSMPTRSRAPSESHAVTQNWNRWIPILSHSPPVGSPMSASDSTASSYNSIPDAHCDHHHGIPMTPEEIITEEDLPDCCCKKNNSGYVIMGNDNVQSGTNNNNDYVPMAPESSRQETPEGYVPMTPGQTTITHDGYTDMSPRDYNAGSNSASMSSVTSGTPSTDMRFADYPLDKVTSYVSADDDDRPARAYSVGSKPPGILLRTLEMAGTPENHRMPNHIESLRTRAFSVGSKTKKGFNRVLPPIHQNTNQPDGIKSNSAPLLASTPRNTSSHSSIGPMDDLMELDFSRPRSNTNSSQNSMRPTCNHRNSCCVNNRIPKSYVEIKHVTKNEEQPYVDMTQGQRNSAYVDMSGGNSTMLGTSPLRSFMGSPQSDIHIDINRFYGRLNSNDSNRGLDYVDMNQRRQRTSSVSSGSVSSGVRPATSPGYQWQQDYLDMSGKRTNTSSPSVSVSPKNNDYLSMGFSPNQNSIPEVPNQTPEGYVEMTPGIGSIKHFRQSSLDSARISGSNPNEDYLNMSGNKTNDKNPKSQPIAIQTTASSGVTSSPLSITSLLGGRKNSSGTPPRMHLPISSWSSHYSSLPRQKSRQNSVGSKDSPSSSTATSSSPITSPANRTTVGSTFKIPQSVLSVSYKPVTKPKEETSRVNEDYAMMDFGKPQSSNSGTTDDYVNYCPGSTSGGSVKKPTSQTDVHEDTNGDYAIMKPGAIEPLKGGVPILSSMMSMMKVGQPSQNSCFKPINENEENASNKKTADTSSRLTGASVDNTPAAGPSSSSTDSADSAYEKLRPASSNSDTIKTTATSTSPRPFASNEKLSSTNSRPASVCSDTKVNISRPGSTTSVHSNSSSSTVMGTSSRPASVNSDRATMPQLHYASLDLATCEETSKSPRTDGQPQNTPTFVYAEIDFIKSESLKGSSNTNGHNASTASTSCSASSSSSTNKMKN